MNKFINLISKSIKYIKCNPPSKKTVIISASFIAFAPITCSIALIPLNIITGVSCLDENGSIRRNGKIISMLSNTKLTPFEKIISTQGAWLWLLMGFGHPGLFLYFLPYNFGIVLETGLAYPLAIHHMYSLKYYPDYYKIN